MIEIHVAPGDTVAIDDPLLTLESDKATMDVPAPFAGEVAAVEVAVGDRVSQGTRLLTIVPASDAAGRGSGSKAAAVASDGAPTEAAAPDAIGAALDSEPPRDGRRAPATLPDPQRARLRQPRRPPRRRGSAASTCTVCRAAVAAGGSRLEDLERDGRTPLDDPGEPRRARARPVAEGRLRALRPGRARPALPDPAHLRAESGAQLGDDPPRHPQRRGRHHRPRGLAPPAERARARPR